MDINPEDSILLTTKKLLNLTPDCTAFDQEIIVHINSSFWRFRQLGVRQDNFSITDETATWSDYFGEDDGKMEIVKSWIWMNVRLLFDPPTNNASLLGKYQEQLEKYESLIVYECDPHYE
jgi:hypothetical protein